MFSSILTLNFDLIFGLSLAFWNPIGLFWWLGSSLKFVLEFNHIVQQLLFSMFPTNSTFDFDLYFIYLINTDKVYSTNVDGAGFLTGVGLN